MDIQAQVLEIVKQNQQIQLHNQQQNQKLAEMQIQSDKKTEQFQQKLAEMQIQSDKKTEQFQQKLAEMQIQSDKKTEQFQQKLAEMSQDRDRNTKEGKAKGDDEKPETNTKREEVSDFDDSDLGFCEDFGLEDPSPSTSTRDIGINTESLRDKPQYPEPAGAEQDGAISTDLVGAGNDGAHKNHSFIPTAGAEQDGAISTDLVDAGNDGAHKNHSFIPTVSECYALAERILEKPIVQSIGKFVFFLCLMKTCTYFGIGGRESIDDMARNCEVYSSFYSEVVGNNNNNKKKIKKIKKNTH